MAIDFWRELSSCALNHTGELIMNFICVTIATKD